MSIVRPFKGVMYNPEKVLLKQVITPPYDVISPEMREKFLIRSQYNAVHIDLPVGGDDRYTQAGALYKQWRGGDILIKSERPAFYLYEQIYEFEGRQYVRTGFVGILKLSEFGKGQVYPHEKTLAGPKIDRYELMKTSKANFSQIFGLYQDSENRLNTLFSEVKKMMPTASAIDDEMVKHSVWAISDSEQLEKIQTFMSSKAIYIADGHHRYETALKYRDDMRKNEGISADDLRPYDYVMMMFVNFMDEGLKVFPTHRVVDVCPDFSDEGFLNSQFVKDTFEIVPLENMNSVKEFMATTAEMRGAWAFMGKSGFYGMKLVREAMESLHPIYRTVDTYLLENLVLKKYFEFTEDKLLAKDGIHFIQTFEEINKFRATTPSVAFILHPESMDAIRHVSESGLVMPQKSTYFYPKLATGLLFNDL